MLLGATMRFLLVTLVLVSARSEAGLRELVGRWARSCGASTVAATVAPFMDFGVGHQTKMRTVYTDKLTGKITAGGTLTTTMVERTTIDGRECFKQESVNSDGGKNTSYFEQVGDVRYEYSETERRWMKTDFFAEPKDGLKWTARYTYEDGSPVASMPLIDYEWVIAGEFTNPASKKKYQGCYRLKAQAHNGHPSQSIHAPGALMIYHIVESKGANLDHVMEQFLVD